MEDAENILLSCVFIGLLLVPILFISRIVQALFSRGVRLEIRKYWSHYLVWFVVSILLIGILFPVEEPNIRVAQRAYTYNEMDQIRNAILSYQTEYEVPPPGKDNVSIIRELESHNPRHIPFLNRKIKDRNANGEALDIWGIPLRINLTDPQYPIIQSAGPDKKWGTPDDLDDPKDQQ